LVLRTASNGDSLLIAVTTHAEWPQAMAFARRIQESVPSLVGVLRREPRSGAKLLIGRDWIEEEVAGLKLRTSGEAFFQVNTALTPTLVETALSMAQIRPGQRALDVFCGVGLFSLAMAQRGASVLGIEANAGAVRNAGFNAQQNGLGGEFRAGDAARELRRLIKEGQTGWDVVLLDPPRAGAADCLDALTTLNPQRIVYVSCDPATLARDI
jgi:23S rRNA (uracil1939-C5)-methyltransferase